MLDIRDFKIIPLASEEEIFNACYNLIIQFGLCDPCQMVGFCLCSGYNMYTLNEILKFSVAGYTVDQYFAKELIQMGLIDISPLNSGEEVS